MASRILLEKEVDIKELQNGTEIELAVDKFYSSSDDDDFDDEISNNFKEEFNKIKIEEEEINLADLTVDELKLRMTPVTEDGLVMKVTTVEGTGVQMTEKCIVKINYNAYIETDSILFDSTYLRGCPHTFILGTGQLILGLDKGIATMRKGERAKFWIHYTYAYLQHGCPPRIPAKANIICDVEVVNFFECNDAIEFEEMLRDDQQNAPFDKVHEACRSKLKLGNNLFRQKNFEAAVSRYSRAVKLLEQVNAADEKDDEKRDGLLLILYINLTLINLRMNNASRAIFNASKAEYLAEHLNENLPMVNCILGQSYTLNSDFEKARKHLIKAKKMTPNDPNINNALANLDDKANRYSSYEKKFCQNIFRSEIIQPPDLKESRDFKKIIDDTISCFINSDETEYEFPSKFSESQVETVKAVVQSHNLYFFDKVYKDRKILKVKKPTG